MAANKRFYWLKLHENFFNRAVIRYLRKLPDGDTIVLIYLELLCISLSSEGYICTEGLLPSIEEDIALMLDEDAMRVRLALAALEKSNLITKGTDETLFMEEFPAVVGSETASTRRVREYRKRERITAGEDPQGVTLKRSGVTLKHECNADETQCNASETKRNADETKCNTEIDIEIETEIEKEIESEREGEKETFLCGTYHNVRLSHDEFQKLTERFPDDHAQKIDRLSRYMQSSGKSYKNHYLTICKWAKQDEKRARSAVSGTNRSGFPDYSVKEGESY